MLNIVIRMILTILALSIILASFTLETFMEMAIDQTGRLIMAITGFVLFYLESKLSFFDKRTLILDGVVISGVTVLFFLLQEEGEKLFALIGGFFILALIQTIAQHIHLKKKWKHFEEKEGIQ